MRRNPLILTVTALAVVSALAWRSHRAEAQDRVASGQSAESAGGGSSATELPRLIEFGSDVCVSCKAMMPVLEELRDEHAEVLRIEFIDVWKSPEQAEAYDVQIIPTQLFLGSDGTELARHEGFYSAEAIRARWDSLGVPLASTESAR